MMSSFFYKGLEALGIPQITRGLRQSGVLLCYHNVCPDDGSDGSCAGGGTGLHMSLSRFAEQAQWLARHYDVVPLAEFAQRARAGRSLRRLAALTFDDGYQGVFEHALPLLRSLNLPACVFVIAGMAGRTEPFWWDRPDLSDVLMQSGRDRLLGELQGDEHAIRRALGLNNDPPIAASLPRRAASWQTIAAAARQGVAIGAHSMTHRALTSLSDAEMEWEVQACRDVIASEIGVRPDFFAYPYGLWNAQVSAAVRSAGYWGAVTLDPGPNATRSDPWALRRINIPAGMTYAAFRAWTAGLNPRWMAL